MRYKESELPVISVIVPIYNVEQYLSQCIESILGQTYACIEIILVDDGSTDQSGGLCDSYALKDNRIKVIHKENGGLVSARKAGVNAAQGKYIAFVDGDDWIEPDSYQKLLEGCQGADIITFAYFGEYGDYRTTCFNGLREGMYHLELEKELLYQMMLMNDNFYEFGILPSLACKLVKKEIIIENQNKVSDRISYGEDAACTFPCFLDAGSIYVTNKLLYHYRQRQGSIVKSGMQVHKSNFSDIYRLLFAKFESVPSVRETLQEHLHYYMWFILLTKLYADLDMGMPLFPFLKVKHGARIALYGAGSFGQAVKAFCDNTKEVEVAGWSDLHYDTYQKQGLDVKDAAELVKLDFDVMVITILNEKLAVKIKDDFISRGIPEKKIDWVKKDVLESMQLPDWL